jgi:hypothetical protein
MASIGELLINVVNQIEPKMLIGSTKKVHGQVQVLSIHLP